MKWTLEAPFVVLVIALAAGVNAEARLPNLPTEIEQALIERACNARQDPGTLESDGHLKCLSTQLVALRADFGRNLNRLSASSRSKLDSICSPFAERRDSYVECLSAQLLVMGKQWTVVKISTSAEATPPASVVSESVALQLPLMRQISSWSFPSSWSSPLVIGGTLATIFVVSGVVGLATKSRRARRVCHVCGAAVHDSGTLCQTCRTSPAGAFRRAAPQRATQSARDEERVRQQKHEEELRRLKAREDEREQRRKEEEALQLEMKNAARRREEDARRRLQAEDEDRRRRQATVVSGLGQEAFDPYAILGIPHDTSLEGIRNAYREAHHKYDLNQVAHLGEELQQYFKTKAQAVERAYQMLDRR